MVFMQNRCYDIATVKGHENKIPHQNQLKGENTVKKTNNIKRRIIAGLLSTITVFSVGAVAITSTSAYISDWSKRKDSIEEYFNSLEFDRDNFFNNYLEDKNTAKSKTVQNADGSISVVQMKCINDNETMDTFGVAKANINTVYPGALLKANQGLITGNPTPIKLRRANLNITIPEAYMKDGKSVATEVDPTNASAVNAAIAELRSNFKKGTDMPSNLVAKIEKVDSDEQIKAKMNFSQSMWGSLKVDASTDYQTSSQVVVVDINQIFYTVSADNVTDADLFADSVKLTQIKKEITSKEPPVMVSNVNYGKRLVACIKTDDMSFDLKTTVKASGLGGKIKGGAEAEVSEKLKKCSVRVFTLGGSSETSGKYLNVSVDELMEMVAKNTKYDGYAEPISYTTRWATDGTIAQSNYIGVQWEAKEVKKLTDTIPIHFEFRKNEWMGTLIEKATMKIYGRRILGINEDGTLVRSNEQLLKTVTLDYETKEEFKLSADVLSDSVKFVFDFEGTAERIDDEAQRTITLHQILLNTKDYDKTIYDYKVLNFLITNAPAARAYVNGRTTDLIACVSLEGKDGVRTSVSSNVPVAMRNE